MYDSIRLNELNLMVSLKIKKIIVIILESSNCVVKDGVGTLRKRLTMWSICGFDEK